MEIIINILQECQLNFFQVLAACLILFITGYRLGIQKSKRLNKKIDELERDVLELNAELLLDRTGS